MRGIRFCRRFHILPASFRSRACRHNELRRKLGYGMGGNKVKTTVTLGKNFPCMNGVGLKRDS